MDTTKSYSTKATDAQERWYLIDAEDQILGRVSTVVAEILRGKYNPRYAPHIDVGDHVVIINADKVKFTGKRLDQKMYRHHSGYLGGLKETSLREMMAKRPEDVLMHSVKGMLPKTKLGRAMLKKLRVYAGPEHKHQAQQPVPFELTNIK